MIVLDTNQLDQLGGPQGALAVMLNRVAGHSGHLLAIPEIVLTEHLAHYEHQVDMQINTARSAFAALEKLDAQPRTEFNAPSIEHSIAKRKSVLEEWFTILPTPEGVEREALQREARRKRPADITWEKKGAGARDVVVWLTVLDAVVKAEEDVLFVSQDHDFTDGKRALHAELQSELDARAVGPHTLIVHPTVFALIESVAQKVALESSFDPAEASCAAAAPYIKHSVETFGLEALKFWRSARQVAVHAEVTEIRATRRGKTQVYQIGNEQWISAELRWVGVVDVTANVQMTSEDAVPFLDRQQIPFTFDGTWFASRQSGSTDIGLSTLLSSSDVRFDESQIPGPQYVAQAVMRELLKAKPLLAPSGTWLPWQVGSFVDTGPEGNLDDGPAT